MPSPRLRHPMCPGTELNRYPRFGGQDFKSCVSTSSTTGANTVFSFRFSVFGFRFSVGCYRTTANCKLIAVNSKIHKQKIPPLGMELSGRRGSNPRPQPWQGCALPTELLPHVPRISDSSEPRNSVSRKRTLASLIFAAKCTSKLSFEEEL